MDKVEEKKDSGLLNTIYKCIKCNSMAFEYEKNKFRCFDMLNCNTVWEVIQDD